MTSAIEIVPLSSDVASSDMSAAISPKKRVRKAIIKPKNSEKSEKMAEKLEKPFPEPIIQQKISEKLEKPFPEPIIQPKNDATNIPSEESVPKKAKKSSARGAKLISGGNNDSAYILIKECRWERSPVTILRMLFLIFGTSAGIEPATFRARRKSEGRCSAN